MPEVSCGVSVIVCCYNSAARLPETLRHLAMQDFQAPWEIIVVDNNSSDRTAEAARLEWGKYPAVRAGFQLVSEPTPGLNHARAKGVTAAAYEYILFCDDDNWLQPDFLSVAYEVIRSNRLIGAVGGECTAVKEGDGPFPVWFEAVQNNYAVGRQADHSGDVTARGYLWGAGLMISKTVFSCCVDQRFPFLLTDRKGKLLSSGGDTELCSRIILCGYRLYYDERLKLKHFIPADRLTPAYFEQLISGIDAAHEQLTRYYNLIRINGLGNTQQLFGGLKSLAKLLLAGFVRKWDRAREKQLFYLYTGINTGVDRDLKMLKKFNRDAVKAAR